MEEDVAFFNPSTATLRAKSGSDLGELLAPTLSYTSIISRLFTGHRCINPTKAASFVYNLLKNWVKKSAAWRGKIRLTRRILLLQAGDPVVRMEVYPDAGCIFYGRLACTVVFVPGFEVKGHMYMSLSDRGQPTSGHQWIRSFAVDEQKKLKQADDNDHGYRKMVLTTLNILRRRVPSLEGLDINQSITFNEHVTNVHA